MSKMLFSTNRTGRYPNFECYQLPAKSPNHPPSHPLTHPPTHTH